MKPIIVVSLLCLITAMLVPGCKPSDEQVKQVIKVGSEIAELQQQYYIAITDLGKVAMQIEAIAKRQDPAAKAMALEIGKTQDLNAAAFAAGQIAHDSFIHMPKEDVVQYIEKSEANKALLKQALDKATDAARKSHELIDALTKAETTRQIGKK